MTLSIMNWFKMVSILVSLNKWSKIHFHTHTPVYKKFRLREKNSLYTPHNNMITKNGPLYEKEAKK
jgi:hypothetical protein